MAIRLVARGNGLRFGLARGTGLGAERKVISATPVS